MCLIDKKRFRFTIFPKIVYKRFYYNPDTKELQNFCRLDKVTSKVLIPDSYDEPEYNEVFKDYIFEGGFIHAMSKPFGKQLPPIVKSSAGSGIIYTYTFKCIIPPFTRYAIDYAIDTCGNICARRMIIIDKLAKYVFN